MSHAHPSDASAPATAATRRPALAVRRPRPRIAPAVDRWELDGVDGGDRTRCAAFLDRIEQMTRAEWIGLGRRAATPASEAPRAAAAALAAVALAAVLDARRLAVTAWLVRDAVTTATHVAPPGRAAPRATAAESALLAAGREAASLAALALLARPWLSRAHLAALLTPFLAVLDAQAHDATERPRTARDTDARDAPARDGGTRA